MTVNYAPARTVDHASARTAPTPESMRHALAAFPTGVALVAAQVQGRTVGMLANSFGSVSLDPPLVSIAFARTSSTRPVLRRAERWGISVLGADDAQNVAALSRPALTRFDDIPTEIAIDGSVLLAGAAATFTVQRHAEVDAGDHVLTLLRVLDLHRDDTSLPLVFHGSALRRLAA